MTCEHPECPCEIPPGTTSEERFCSDECRRSYPATPCACGHPMCGGAGGTEVM